MLVTRLGRYPVKSFQGETVNSAPVNAFGLAGDRHWAVVDTATGKAMTAKREGRLLEASATTGPDGAVQVTLPDGTSATAGDPSLHAALSAWLGKDVQLREANPDIPASYEMNVVNTDQDSPLGDIPCPPGTFLDFGAVHLITTASLRAIAAHYPEGDWSVERFRPTVLIEADGDEFVEDDWIGRTVRIGDLVVQPFMPTVRCAMTTRAQPVHGLARDLGIAKAVNHHHGASLGVYAVVTQPGGVSLGDGVVVGD